MADLNDPYLFVESGLLLRSGVRSKLFRMVHLKLTVPISGYMADAYYAPKVGLIKSDAVNSGVTSITELKSYSMANS